MFFSVQFFTSWQWGGSKVSTQVFFINTRGDLNVKNVTVFHFGKLMISLERWKDYICADKNVWFARTYLIKVCWHYVYSIKSVKVRYIGIRVHVLYVSYAYILEWISYESVCMYACVCRILIRSVRVCVLWMCINPNGGVAHCCSVWWTQLSSFSSSVSSVSPLFRRPDIYCIQK